MITATIVFDHRGRTKAGKEGPLELRITHARKPYYINTGIKVLGREFRDGQIINRADADVLQAQLELITLRYKEAVLECIKKGTPINVAEIRKQAYNINITRESSASMFDWLTKQVPKLNISAGTRRRYDVLLRRLDQFDKLKSWDDLTVENLYEFDAWLHQITKAQSNGDRQAQDEPQKIGDSAVYNYHRTLKSLLNRAVKMNIIASNPYERLKGEFSRGVKESVEYLTEEEIAAVESLHPMKGTQMAMARDLFVFQLYTGLSYSDAQAFDISEYKHINGRWINTGERIKTGVPYVSQLLPQAVEVLERYNWQVPQINNMQYNASLKDIQKALGIRTRLHSHLARHTFATRMLAMGVKIENVSRMLGHSNITMTQRYAKVLAESVHEDFDMIAKKLTQNKNL
jgi:integrase